MDDLNAQDPVSMADLAPTEAAEDLAIVPPAVDVFKNHAKAAAEAGEQRPDSCQWCRAELPVRENLNFCPFCGTDLKLVPCGGCGEELEMHWRFCISCGTEVSA